MVEVCSLASGSKGNSYFVKIQETKILVDVGVSMKKLSEKLSLLGYSLSDIDHIFITHEHSDHIKGLRTLVKHYDIPIHITKKTYEVLNFEIKDSQLQYIRKNSEMFFKNFIIQTVEKPHDAVDPVFFNFYYKDKKVAIITDIGYITQQIIDSIKDADILFLETNYDKEMLYNGPYEFYLKKRIDSKYGHLSNCSAAITIENYATDNLKYLFLSHISENNNDPLIIKKLFDNVLHKRDDLKHLKINFTSQDKISEKAVL